MELSKMLGKIALRYEMNNLTGQYEPIMGWQCSKCGEILPEDFNQSQEQPKSECKTDTKDLALQQLAALKIDNIGAAHYQGVTTQPIDLIEANGFGIEYHMGEIIAKVCRHRKKEGLTDLKKAKWHLERLIILTESGLFSDTP